MGMQLYYDIIMASCFHHSVLLFPFMIHTTGQMPLMITAGPGMGPGVPPGMVPPGMGVPPQPGFYGQY